jgi:hypothetical protein
MRVHLTSSLKPGKLRRGKEARGSTRVRASGQVTTSRREGIVMIGKRFNRLTVIGESQRKSTNRGKVWYCLCDCGAFSHVEGSQLRGNHVKSCGCLRRENHLKSIIKHGNTWSTGRTKEYVAWANMLTRCRNPRSSSFDRYGVRGIKVCEEWEKDFAAFLKDMGSCPHGFSLDRINNNGDYCPNNCRWATLKEQANNKRNNRIVDWNNKHYTLAELADSWGVSWFFIRDRLRSGKSLHEIWELTKQTPSRAWRVAKALAGMA